MLNLLLVSIVKLAIINIPVFWLCLQSSADRAIAMLSWDVSNGVRSCRLLINERHFIVSKEEHPEVEIRLTDL